MITKLFSAKHTTKTTRRNAIRRRMFRPEHLEDRRLLAASATFMGLGDLPGGAYQSKALGISDDGKTVVGNSVVDDTGTGGPFKWNVSDQSMTALPHLPGADSYSARAASADGSVIVGRAGSESALWQNDTVETIASPTTKGSRGAYDVSDNGLVIVGANDNGAYRWEGGDIPTTTALGNLSDSSLSSVAYAVSGDGAYVVGQGTTADAIVQPFRWHADTGLVSLGFAGFARDVSANGSVLTGRAFEEVPLKGNRTSTISEPFRWTDAGGKQLLGDLPGGDHSGTGYAISSDGSIIAGQSSSSNGMEAFVWESDTGMRSLNEILTEDYGVVLGGWQLTTVWDMTPDGSTLVGQGINPDGNTEAFIVSFKPSTPSFSVNDVEITEGDSGTAVAQFTVSRSGDSSSAVSVDVSTSDGTATVADNDYVAVSRTLQFDAGVTQMTFDVTVNGDFNEEADETFFVNLTNPSTGATVSDGQGVGTIIDDDTNYAPIAVDDAASVASGDSVGIDVLANDSDPDGDPLSFASVPDFSDNNGSVTVNADNTLTYTPPATFVGTDAFTYTITDGQSTSTATVSIAVTDTASMYVAAIALIEQPRGKNGTEYLISVLVNDVQSNNPLAGVQVTVFIDGKTYTGTTDSEGIFITESLKGIKSGTYSAQVDLALSDYDYELAPSLDSSLYEDDSDKNGLADADLTIS